MTTIAPAATGGGRPEYAAGGRPEYAAGGRADYREVALVDLLDRVLSTGVVIAGDLTLSIADVDLVRISLRALVSSVRAAVAQPESGGLR